MTPTLERIHGKIEVAQTTSNSLGNVDFKNQYEHHSIDSGASNLLGWLHPECRYGGVAL
jgi:hypothetical protein